MIKYGTTLLIFISLMVVKNPVVAQTVTVNDDFSDGDFTNNPTWTDSEGKFTVNSSNRLQLDDSAAGEAVISTPSSAVFGQWDVLVQLDFNPSGSNLAKYYVLSNTTDMKGDVDGYYIEVGGTDDEVSLYRQDGGTSTKIIDGPDDVVDNDPVNVRLRLTRDVNGNWELFADPSGGMNFTSQGTTTDQTYTASSYIGLFCDYTSTRSDLFQFDDVQVTKQNPPLRIQNLAIQNSSTFNVTFNIDVDPSSVDPGDFSFDNDGGSPASATVQSDNQTVRLAYNNPLPGGQYTLTVDNVDDSDGNTIAANTTTSFTLYDDFAAGDVIINEFVYDPASNQSEYVELKNTTGKYLNLQGWQLGDDSGNDTIASDTLTLQPNGYLVISDDTTTLSSTYGSQPYVQPGSVPALNNSGDVVKVLTGSSARVDSLRYNSSWGGNNVALERRSDSAPSIYKENFGDSPNALGGTPGQANEIADDTTPPDLAGLTITNDQTLDLNFTERLANGPATNAGNYILDNGISVSSVRQTAGDSVRLSLSSPLQNGVAYQLSVDNQQDIFANTAARIDTTFNYYVVSPADSGDVFINEFLYSPPSGSSEYIELYNPTSKSFDLNGWTISDNRGNPASITDSQYIVPPDSFVVIAPDNSLAANYPEAALVNMANNFPSLNDSGDAIVLRDSTGQRLDSLTYTPDFGGDEVALERRTTSVPPIKSNFGEAPNGFGTPGSANQIGQDNTPPDLQSFKIVSNQSLQFVFTENVTNQSATNTDNYSIDNGLSISSATLSGGDTVRVNLSSQLQNNTTYATTIDGVKDIFGNGITNRDTTFTYYQVSPADSGDIFINEFTYDPPSGSTEYIELYNTSGKSLDLQDWTVNDNTGNRNAITGSQYIVPPNSFVVLAPDQTLKQDYPDAKLVALGSRFPSLNNSGDAIVLRDASGERLDSLTYTPAFGGDTVAVERRTTDAPPVQSNFGDAPNGFGTPGSVNQIGQDTNPPTVDGFVIVNDQTLALHFSEGLQTGPATNTNNFSLNNGINVTSAQQTADDSVRLSLDASLQNNTRYQISVQDQQDIFGNTSAPFDTSFTYFQTSAADSGDIFINEFTYDPPEGSTEYIELYNTSGKSLDLQDWTINDNTGNRNAITGSQYIVPPNSFVVLAPDQTLKQDYPDAKLVALGSRFPSLNNSGDAIVLRDASGERLDSLTYTPAFGGDNVAVERRTTDAPPVQSNFGDAPNGFGTPGSANQIGQDTTPPSLDKLIIAGNQTLKLAFSEGLDEGPATNTGNYAIDNGITVDNAHQITADSVQLNLSSPLLNNTSYQLTINNQQDIFGNSAGQIDTAFTYYQTSPADSGDIFINEFTYDPPSGSTEYIELYNTSGKSLDLQDWTINDNTGNRNAITGSQFIVPPNSFVVLAPDQTLKQDYPDAKLVALGSRFPSLNNSGDAIVLRDASGERLDSLTYTPAFGGDTVAVERRTTNAPPVQSNFGDAPNGFGTPGSANQIEQDTTPPSLKAFSIVDDQSLQFVFSEALNQQSATDKGNYEISGELNITSARLAGSNTVNVNLSGSLQNNTSYTATVQSLDDTFGNTTATIDTTFTYYQTSPVDSGDIFINEFTSDPPSGSTEYIELYNTSEKSLDLQNWTVNDGTGNRQIITGGQYIVPPNDYVVLAPDATVQQNNPDAKIVTMRSRFPSLNNSGDAIVLRDADGQQLDSLSYTSTWGGNNIALERRSTEVAPVKANFGDAPNGFGTPGAANDIQPDKTPPSLKSIFPVDQSTLQLTFSESITGPTATNKSNYAFSPSRNIQFISAIRDTVNIVLNQDLVSGQQYDVTVTGLQDLFGNTIPSTTQQATYVQISDAQPGSIVINEILFTRESAGDPEFVELYNPTDKNFNLKNWSIGDASGTTSITGNPQLRAGQYLVITDNQTFANAGDSRVYLNSFPSLNDDEDAVYIQNENDVIIDSLFYHANTFGGNIDGRSAERKDPQAASNDPSNFATSTAKSGSTPNNQNSVLEADTSPPSIKFARLLPNGNIQVNFSEFITLNNKVEFSLNGKSLTVASFNPNEGNTIILNAPSSVQSGTKLTLKAENVTDVKGNSNQPNALSIEVSQLLSKGDVVINEILYDPLNDSDDNKPDQAEYVELRNTRDYAVLLEGMTLHDAPDENGDVRTLDPVTTKSKFIPAQGTALVYAGETVNFKQSRVATFFELSDQPETSLIRMDRSTLSLASSGDAIYLADTNGGTIDSVFYDESWQNQNLADTKGIALERINPEGPSSNDSNWGSSTAERGGTPNAENSIYQQPGDPQNQDTGISFNPNPFSPDGDGTDDRLFINYKLDRADYLITVRIYDRYGREVRELADGKAAGFNGSLIWDGRKDDGTSNRIGIYIVVFKAFDSADGKNRAFKKTVVLARRLH